MQLRTFAKANVGEQKTHRYKNRGTWLLLIVYLLISSVDTYNLQIFCCDTVAEITVIRRVASQFFLVSLDSQVAEALADPLACLRRGEVLNEK